MISGRVVLRNLGWRSESGEIAPGGIAGVVQE